MFLLFPGRHILNTRFQEEYMAKILCRRLGAFAERDFINHPPQAPEAREQTLESIIFAITSFNQDNSRFNPLPGHERMLAAYEFSRQIEETYGVSFSLVGIPDFGNTPRFVHMTLAEIAEQTGQILTPENTVVLCSTPGVIKLYDELGFSVLPAELISTEPEKYRAPRPVDVVRMIGEAGESWNSNRTAMTELSHSTRALFRRFPQMPGRIARLYSPSLEMLTETGSLTGTRDYDSYAFGMGNTDIIRFKYEDIRHAIKGGRIVDEGCADGALLMEVAQDFPDSGLIGVDVSGEFIARFSENIRQHRFGGAYVHVKQANIMSPTSPDNSVDTTICNSTMHELWSYLNQADSVRAYLAKAYRQTRRGGRIVIRDVVGPEDKDKLVYMLCNDEDGSNQDVYADFEDDKALAAHLNGLSTHSRFLRFSKDFLADMRQKGRRGLETKVKYGIEEVDGRKYIVTTLKTAAEFMLTKDYTDNWRSEMNEEFTYRGFSEHKRALEQAGFKVIENPNDPMSGSRAYTSPWIAEHSFMGKTELYTKGLDRKLRQMEYPVTNMVLVGEKA